MIMRCDSPGISEGVSVYMDLKNGSNQGGLTLEAKGSMQLPSDIQVVGEAFQQDGQWVVFVSMPNHRMVRPLNGDEMMATAGYRCVLEPAEGEPEYSYVQRNMQSDHIALYPDGLLSVAQSQLVAACVGCRHYHGQSYGGTLLVCAMHPDGPESDQCPDWSN